MRDLKLKLQCCFIAFALSAATVAQAADDSRAPSFREDVVPVLTRYGCNSGGCHGKLAGQNGFRLSLRGFAPEQDYEWLTREFMGRRINAADPATSALIRKPLMQSPHQGGKLFAEDSQAHRVLLDWIKAGAPGPVKDEPRVVKMEVTFAAPGVAGAESAKPRPDANSASYPARTMKLGDRVPLKAIASYADGRVRDVTWLAQFFSSDETVVKVSPEGIITAVHAGEAAIRVHFQEQVQVVIATIPFENKLDDSSLPKPANVIDEHVFAKLRELNIPASALCDDATFLRRAMLDTLGTLPTPDEVTTFVADANADKRAKLVEALLQRPEYIDYWTLQLADLLQNRKERDHDVRGPKGVRSFHYWLRAQVAANQPWNRITRDILTAQGDVVESPAVGYFIVTVGEMRPADRSEVVGSVSQSFLGTRVGCAKCHNHPSEKYTQDDYYHFAAFFSRVSMDRQDMYKGSTALDLSTEHERNLVKRIAQIEKKISELEAEAAGAESHKADEKKKQIDDQRKQLDNTRKELEQSKLKMPRAQQPRTNEQLAPQPLDRMTMEIAPGADPREALVNWMLRPENEYFAGNMVNRLWKHFLREGLVEPVDDLRSSNPPTNAGLWKVLCSEFVSHGYDLKHIMRLILSSRTYQLSSTTLPGNERDGKFYSHYYAKRLPAEVLLDAISEATQVPDRFPGYPKGMRAIQLPDPGVNSYFLGLFGRSDRVTACACERAGEVTLPQLLHMQNGELLNKFTDGEGRLKRLLKDHADDAALIEQLFLATLSRSPSEQERERVLSAIKDAANREEAMQDVFWALVNTKEFAFNH
ncbi:MAG: DUF1549 domain-containing protein [Phycisphaeraceae bacterium]